RVGSFEWDPASEQVRWSDELYRIHGLEPGTPVTLRSHELCIVPEDRERAVALLRRGLRAGQSFDAEYRLLRADGAVRVIHTRGRSASTEEGATARVFGTCQDVTERTLAEEQQMRTREALDRSQEELRQAQK